MVNTKGDAVTVGQAVTSGSDHDGGRIDCGTVAIIGTRGYPSYYGGFETAVRHLAPYLSRQGWHVRVYSRKPEIWTDDPRRDKSVEIVTTRGIDSKALSTLSFGFTASLHAFVHKPDVAFVMNVANGFWLPLLKLRGIPTVVNVDGIEWHREKWGRMAKRVFRLGAWLTAKFADTVVFDALAIGDHWRREFRRDGIFIPYGGAPADRVPLQEPGLQPGKYALLVARFVAENTVEEFIEAAKEIAEQYDVVLVGSAPPGDRLFDLARIASTDNPRIRWLGHISDDSRLYALWQNAGAYFHGHSVGGTNPALVQAMALGARIVARDTVYNREVLGDAATFCPPDSPAIAAAVIATIESTDIDPRTCIERARTHYSWESVCEAYSLALQEQLTQRPAGV